VWEAVGECHQFPLEAVIRQQSYILRGYGVSADKLGRVLDLKVIQETFDSSSSEAEIKAAIVSYTVRRKELLLAYRRALRFKVFQPAAGAIEALLKSVNWRQGDLAPLSRRLVKLQRLLGPIRFAPYQRRALIISALLDEIDRQLFKGRPQKARALLEDAGKQVLDSLSVLELTPEEVKMYFESDKGAK
jgi:hypothetical protein